jgi:uncharacterized protein (DUF1684 family)
VTDIDEPRQERAASLLDLLDWKRRVFDLYREVRASPNPSAGWDRWRAAREDLFRSHPQSPIPEDERSRYPGIPLFPYQPAARVLADIHQAPAEHYDIATSGQGTYGFTRFALASFELDGTRLELELYWLDGYGGGLFLPFRDATAGRETYGGGRYLLDTVKGSDLGVENGRLILDFNFAYNPSCAYDPAWVCPLAPPANRFRVPVRAGERMSSAGGPTTTPAWPGR